MICKSILRVIIWSWHRQWPILANHSSYQYNSIPVRGLWMRFLFDEAFKTTTAFSRKFNGKFCRAAAVFVYVHRCHALCSNYGSQVFLGIFGRCQAFLFSFIAAKHLIAHVRWMQWTNKRLNAGGVNIFQLSRQPNVGNVTTLTEIWQISWNILMSLRHQIFIMLQHKKQ